VKAAHPSVLSFGFGDTFHLTLAPDLCLELSN
jgi:hypothetical protein